MHIISNVTCTLRMTTFQTGSVQVTRNAKNHTYEILDNAHNTISNGFISFL